MVLVARTSMVAFVLGGCGFTVHGASSDPGDAPIDTPGDVPIDLADDLDDDDDGVPDVTDNCPTMANADQHDEDVDAKGDRCDPCPQVAGADSDADGDGIGDACDPHPATAGDVLVRFDGFGTNLPTGALPSGWTQLGGFTGDWEVSGDMLRVDTQDTPHLLAFDAGSPHTTIEVLLDAALPGANVPSMTAIVDGDAGLTTYLACSLLYTEQSRRLQSFASNLFSPISTSLATVAVPGTHQITATNATNSVGCSFFGGGQLGASFPIVARTYVGLRIRNLRVAIHYIAIYRAP